MSQRRVVTVLVVAAALWGACGDDGSGPMPMEPDPGFVTVRLTTRTGNDGAVQFTVAAVGLDSLRVSSGRIMFTTETATDTHRVIVAGQAVNGALVEFWVPDRNRIEEIVTALESAAARITYQQQDLQGYSLSLTAN